MNEHASERCVFFFFLKRSKLFVQRCISIVDPRLKFDVRKLSQNEESQPSFSRSIFHPLVRYRSKRIFRDRRQYVSPPPPPLPSSPINLISFLGCGVFIFPMRTGCCTQSNRVTPETRVSPRWSQRRRRGKKSIFLLSEATLVTRCSNNSTRVYDSPQRKSLSTSRKFRV